MLGQTEKMVTELLTPVNYELRLGENRIPLNPLIGKQISFKFTGRIFCVHCKKITKKSFNQGYCYQCFISLAQCDMCILKPETCHFAKGTCREPDWGEKFCFQPHIVYLANSSGLKVGITRQTQLPTRWIDQGAVQALPIFKVASRYLAGLIEVIFAKQVSDKTSWQQMLKAKAKPIDLILRRNELIAHCQPELEQLCQRFSQSDIEYLSHEQTVNIEFPVSSYPDKIKTFNLDKNAEVSGILQGIKGQYLLLDTGVINIRKYSGYELEFFL